MYRPALMRLAFGVGVLIVLMLALTSCGSESSQQEAKAHPLPEDATALSPGEYHSVKFKPSFSFRVGKGWSTLAPETSDALALSAQGETRWVGFTNVQKVYKPAAKSTQKVIEAPKDMVGWFQDHPYLQTDDPEIVTAGGVEGKQVDLVVEAPEDYYDECGSDACVAI